MADSLADRTYESQTPVATTAGPEAAVPGKATQVQSLASRGAAGPASTAGSAAAATAVPGAPAPAGPVTRADADSAVTAALIHMMSYGRRALPGGVPPAFAAPIDDIARACSTTSTPPQARGALLDHGAAALVPARAACRPDLATHFESELAVVHQHLSDETIAHGISNGDPLGMLMETRGAVGRAGGIAVEMAKLVTVANAKRLAAARKAVDWSAFGQIIAKNAQIVPTDNGTLKQAFGALEGASFEMAFQLFDIALTAAAAGKTIGDHPIGEHPEPQDPKDTAKVTKAILDLSVAALNGCMVIGRAVAVASVEVTQGEQQKMFRQLAEDLGKGTKLVGGTLGLLTAGCDIVTNAVVLLNGAHGIEAADAVAGIAGSMATILAEGSKMLLETGLVSAPAEGMFAGWTVGTVAEIAAMAGPIALTIPLAWLGTKVLLLELGKLRIGITGALMAETFQHLIDDAGELARETEVLGVALSSALDPSADPAVVKESIAARAQLVRARAETLVNHGVNQRANVIKREVSAMARTTRVLAEHDPLAIAKAARATVTGVIEILDRSPELVAEEAGDPTLAARARRGAPAPLPDTLPELPDGSRPLP